ncbi:MAG: phosphopantetheine-binding protein [Defluviitaleaceae bacterium]|nr:phosphopantetheine-binding protein [Defluviitaleaceae bacterium]
MEKLLGILTKMYPDADVLTNEGLVDNGVLDSMGIITLIAEINDKIGVAIPADEILPENFNSYASISALVERLEDY